MIEQIREKFSACEFWITRHCQRCCDSREISLEDIQNVINDGELIETYPNDYPYPSCLILGYIGNHMPP